MPTEFQAYGPFEIPYEKLTPGSAKRIDPKDHIAAFWGQIGAQELAGQKGSMSSRSRRPKASSRGM